MIKLEALQVGSIVDIIDKRNSCVMRKDVSLSSEDIRDIEKNPEFFTIEGVIISDLDIIEKKLGFIKRSMRDRYGNLVVSAVKSVGEYAVTVESKDGKYYVSILNLNSNVTVCSAEVRYIHQIQGLISVLLYV